MKTIFVGTGKEPFVMEFEDELQNLQALVGGRIEVLSIRSGEERSIDLIFNEECKFLFEEVNKWLVFPNKSKDYISGNIICLAADETTGEFDSLTDDEVKFYLEELSKDKVTVTYN